MTKVGCARVQTGRRRPSRLSLVGQISNLNLNQSVMGGILKEIRRKMTKLE